MRKFIAIFLSIILFFVGVFASFAGSYAIFRTPETPIDSSYLMQFTENEEAYYLQKTAADTIFYIESDNKDYTSLFTLTDNDGNEMPKRIEKGIKVAFKILPPDNGYEAGKKYSIVLNNDAKFSGNDLGHARELIFTIEKEDVESYTYADEVKVIKDMEFTTIDDNILDIQDLDVNIGDIIINEMASDAYKIVDILDDGTAIVETPGLDEIFSDLEVYGEYTWDVNDIQFNTDLDIEIEIENSIRNSSFFKSLITTAYAAEDDGIKYIDKVGLKVKYEINIDDNTVKIEVEIKLGPGQNGIFGISKLKNQEVTINLENTIGFTSHCDIEKSKLSKKFELDVSTTVSTDTSWGVSLDLSTLFSPEKDKKDTNSINTMAEYQKVVGDLTKELAKMEKDKESKEITLFSWKIPIPAVPGLYFDASLLLFFEFDAAANITLGGHNSTRVTAGILFRNYEFDSYIDVFNSKSPPRLSINGTVGAKAGIKIQLRLVILHDKVAYIEIDPQAGFYADAFLTYPIFEPGDLSYAGSILHFYGYFEAGLYFGANFRGKVNYLFDVYNYEHELVEIKAPLFDFGNEKISIEIASSRPSIRAINNTFTAPDIVFQYYDVKNGRVSAESLKVEDLKFTIDGEELKKVGKLVTLPSTVGPSFYVNASYKNTGDNKSYNALFKVIVSGSEIEGSVSAYTSSSNFEPISNATVKLFSQNDPNTLIAEAKTDGNGKFSFNVSEGKYILKISAQGYSELTSLQVISKDETKFTEHILLVDSLERGNGTAGGQINNAIDGRNLDGVEIRLRENWNNHSGNYFKDYKTTTSSNGQYRIDDIPVGYYTIEASKDGFYKDYYNIIVHSSDPQYNQNFTISPILPEGQMRIVLRWGENPRDLDSHLIGNKPDGESYNVFYNRMRYSWENTEMANLDVDDTTSYGPETITILQPMDNWIYAIHDYTNRGSTDSDKMSYSGAYVTVFTSRGQEHTFNIPVGKEGTYWTVFEYINGQIRPINAVNNIKPSP